MSIASDEVASGAAVVFFVCQRTKLLVAHCCGNQALSWFNSARAWAAIISARLKTATGTAQNPGEGCAPLSF